MDERTAREAAAIRGRGALGAAVLCAILGLLAAVFATAAPQGASALLWAAAAVAGGSALGCVAVFRANRRLAAAPSDRGPLGMVLGASLGVLAVWVVAVLLVLAVTHEVAWVIAALGLITLSLPTLALSLITYKGPHPTAAVAPPT
ncbi:MAG: hypothetical protein ABIQ61_12565 [Ornithinibacter sp.]